MSLMQLVEPYAVAVLGHHLAAKTYTVGSFACGNETGHLLIGRESK